MLLLSKTVQLRAGHRQRYADKLWCHCGSESIRQSLQMLTSAGLAEMIAEAAMFIGRGSPATAAPLPSPAVTCAWSI